MYVCRWDPVVSSVRLILVMARPNFSNGVISVNINIYGLPEFKPLISDEFDFLHNWTG